MEEDYFGNQRQWIAETDKAWDAIHRALTDGNIAWDNGTYPLSHVILGGECIYFEDDYVMSLKTPSEVADIAMSLVIITRDRLRDGYYRINPEIYGFPVNEEDFAYTWNWFESLRPFFERARSEARYVLFTASQ